MTARLSVGTVNLRIASILATTIIYSCVSLFVSPLCGLGDRLARLWYRVNGTCEGDVYCLIRDFICVSSFSQITPSKDVLDRKRMVLLRMRLIPKLCLFSVSRY